MNQNFMIFGKNMKKDISESTLKEHETPKLEEDQCDICDRVWDKKLTIKGNPWKLCSSCYDDYRNGAIKFSKDGTSFEFNEDF